MPTLKHSRGRKSAHALLAGLFRELFQTEHSAKAHPRREARHLGDTPPSQALRAVSEHAAVVLSELPTIARANQLPVSRAGLSLGALLSFVRETVADRLVESERAYRGTLLGMRHGIDLVKMIRMVADHNGLVEIGGFCTRWLEQREPLVAKVEQALSWFAHHPTAASHAAHKLPERERASGGQGSPVTA
jgi:hypothetical protein